jgi:hypothetical protein
LHDNSSNLDDFIVNEQILSFEDNEENYFEEEDWYGDNYGSSSNEEEENENKEKTNMITLTTIRILVWYWWYIR